MQIFQEKRKKRGFRHDILRIFQKFYYQIILQRICNVFKKRSCQKLIPSSGYGRFKMVL